MLADIHDQFDVTFFLCIDAGAFLFVALALDIVPNY